MNDLANELRKYVEQTNQTNQTVLNQMEKLNQALLQALQIMGNSINNLRNNSSHGKDMSSNELDVNESSSSRILRLPFLPREETQREEEGINQPINRIVENARAYANLELEIRELITFAEFCEGQKHEVPKRMRRYVNKDLKHKVNKVIFPNFDGSRKMTAHAWLQKLNTYFTLSPMTEEDAL